MIESQIMAYTGEGSSVWQVLVGGEVRAQFDSAEDAFTYSSRAPHLCLIRRLYRNREGNLVDYIPAPAYLPSAVANPRRRDNDAQD